MSAKLGFVAGLAVGVLAGSRAGRGLYDRTASAASAVVRDPRVRSGATTVMHKAGDAGSSVAGAAVRKVKSGAGKGGEEAASGDGPEGGEEGERGRGTAAIRGRTKRLIGGVRKHGHRGSGLMGSGGGVKGSGVKGSGVKVSGVKLSRPHLHRGGHGDHAHNGADHKHKHNGADHMQNGARHGGMSAPYVQPKPSSPSSQEDEG